MNSVRCHVDWSTIGMTEIEENPRGDEERIDRQESRKLFTTRKRKKREESMLGEKKSATKKCRLAGVETYK